MTSKTIPVARVKTRGNAPLVVLRKENIISSAVLWKFALGVKDSLTNAIAVLNNWTVDTVDNEEQLERFLEVLMAKGRIPFQQEQAPYYPGTSGGLDRDEKDIMFPEFSAW